jgi:transcription termination/antitermination protein NusG
MGEYIRDLDDNWFINQRIEIIDGPFMGFEGVIYLIDREKKRLRVNINFWGRDTPVELNFYQIKPLD